MVYLFCVFGHCRDRPPAAGDLAFYLAQSVGASMTFCPSHRSEVAHFQNSSNKSNTRQKDTHENEDTTICGGKV